MPRDTISAQKWEEVRGPFRHMYFVQDMTLKQVMQEMEGNGFKATERQYKRKISQWGLDKKVKGSEMKTIVQKAMRRAENGKMTEVRVRGRCVDPEKVERYLKRMDVTEDQLISQLSPVADSLSQVSCYTPSLGSSSIPRGSFGVEGIASSASSPSILAHSTLATASVRHTSHLQQMIELCTSSIPPGDTVHGERHAQNDPVESSHTNGRDYVGWPPEPTPQGSYPTTHDYMVWTNNLSLTYAREFFASDVHLSYQANQLRRQALLSRPAGAMSPAEETMTQCGKDYWKDFSLNHCWRYKWVVKRLGSGQELDEFLPKICKWSPELSRRRSRISKALQGFLHEAGPNDVDTTILFVADFSEQTSAQVKQLREEIIRNRKEVDPDGEDVTPSPKEFWPYNGRTDRLQRQPVWISHNFWWPIPKAERGRRGMSVAIFDSQLFSPASPNYFDPHEAFYHNTKPFALPLHRSP